MITKEIYKETLGYSIQIYNDLLKCIRNNRNVCSISNTRKKHILRIKDNIIVVTYNKKLHMIESLEGVI